MVSSHSHTSLHRKTKCSTHTHTDTGTHPSTIIWARKHTQDAAERRTLSVPQAHIICLTPLRPRCPPSLHFTQTGPRIKRERSCSSVYCCWVTLSISFHLSPVVSDLSSSSSELLIKAIGSDMQRAGSPWLRSNASCHRTFRPCSRIFLQGSD